MTRKQWLANLAVMGLFSFFGGFLGQVVFKISTSDAAGSVSTILSYAADGQPVQSFYGEDGQVRIQLGTYSGVGERGLPLIGLSDNHGHLRMLFRLAGDNESPVLIMKDKNGQDRIVMGLALSDKSEAPFLSIVDEKGQRQALFGAY